MNSYKFSFFFLLLFCSIANMAFEGSAKVKATPLTVSAGENASENDIAGSFILKATDPLEEDVTITFSLTGTAIAGEDYISPGTEVVLPAGDTEVKVTITAIDDTSLEEEETILLNLSSTSNGELYIDGTSGSAEIKILDNEPANAAPVAHAGEDQTVVDTDRNGSEKVTLNGSASTDSDGTIESYSWTEGGIEIGTGVGPEVTLETGTHTIVLTVTDNKGATAEDAVVITINMPALVNVAPVAKAGNDQALTDTDRNGTEAVTLNGSGSSDLDGTISSYIWTEGGNQIATGANPTVTLGVGTHTIRLTVTDNAGDTGTDDVVIVINEPANVAPVAHAGEDQTVVDTDRSGSEKVTLNGSASTDSDGTIESYIWTEGGIEIGTGVGPEVTLETGTHTIVLTVTDNKGATAKDEVVITINAPANVAPVAKAGNDQTLTDTDRNGTEAVTLNGSGSTDSDGTISSYSWTEGGTQIATGVNPTLTLGVGTHTIRLTVTDNAGDTGTDDVVIVINEPAILSVKVGNNGTEDGVAGSFIISSTKALNEPLTIKFSLGGTAERGNDYTVAGLEVVLPAGQTSISITFTIVNDDKVEADETVLISLNQPEREGVILDNGSSSAEMIIKDNEACFTISQQVQDASCSGTADGAINITVAGGSDKLLFSWSNGQKTEDLKNVPAGNYQLEVLDQISGCTLAKQFVVKVNDQTLPIAKGKTTDLPLGANGRATISAQDINDGSSDNCAVKSLSLNKTTFSCADLGQNKVILTVEDVNGNTSSTTVTINVVDNLAPVFVPGQQFSLPEDAPIGTLIGTVEATDNCQTLSWKVADGDEEGLFRIDEAGQIYTRGKLDYERQIRYDLAISATGGGLEKVEIVKIQVLNIDEPGPDLGILLDEYQSVNEDQLYTFDIPFEAFEAPVGETLEYSIYANPAWLSFNENTLRLEGTPGNEDVGVQRITIRATDSQGRFAEQHFRLEVINVNDAPHSLSLSRNLIKENQPEGTVVGHISHEDVDEGDQGTYQFMAGEGDQHNDYFTISNSDLLSTRPLDYEVDSVVFIRLSVTDLAGASFEQVFKIKVVNELDGTAFLPNLFSPNGDRMNDYFILQSAEIGQIHWRIYNRQGRRLVYETFDIEEATQKGWDGTAFGEPQPAGSYMWVMEGSYIDGTPLLIDNKVMGSVTLIR